LKKIIKYYNKKIKNINYYLEIKTVIRYLINYNNNKINFKLYQKNTFNHFY